MSHIDFKKDQFGIPSHYISEQAASLTANEFIDRIEIQGTKVLDGTKRGLEAVKQFILVDCSPRVLAI